MQNLYFFGSVKLAKPIFLCLWLNVEHIAQTPTRSNICFSIVQYYESNHFHQQPLQFPNFISRQSNYQPLKQSRCPIRAVSANAQKFGSKHLSAIGQKSVKSR